MEDMEFSGLVLKFEVYTDLDLRVYSSDSKTERSRTKPVEDTTTVEVRPRRSFRSEYGTAKSWRLSFSLVDYRVVWSNPAFGNGLG